MSTIKKIKKNIFDFITLFDLKPCAEYFEAKVV